MEYLVSRGHDLKTVLYDYTIDQVIAFERAASENNDAFLKRLTIQIRFAQNANKKEFERYLGKKQQKIKRDTKLSNKEITSSLGLTNGSTRGSR